MTTCQHKSVFLDEDEEKCRACGQSLTYPRRAPGPEDARNRKRDTRIAIGENHRRYTPVEQEIIQVEAEVEASPSTRLLPCSCCKEMLPPDSFYARNSPAARNREYRASRCRGCTAFRLRVKRQQDPEGMRQLDRERRERYLKSLTPEQREQETKYNRTSREANTAATQRYRARKEGRGVLKQRRGKNPVLLKPVCRVADTCPLAPYCVDKVATGRAVLSSSPAAVSS